MIKPLPVTEVNTKAVAYVGTNPAEGLAQLEILKRLGCKPESRVLEIGCGALIAGYPIIQYLEPGSYVGIDPNRWLWQSSMKILETRDDVVEKQPCFSITSNFYAGPDCFFDFILSHSILSHTSNAQLDQFLSAVASQLVSKGIAAASIRFAEGNEFGSTGSTQHGPDFQTWQYPGVSWFKRVDVLERARRAGLEATIEPKFTKLIMAANQKSVHDWIILRKV